MSVCGKKLACDHEKRTQMLALTRLSASNHFLEEEEIASELSAIFCTLSNWHTTPAALQEERDSSICETHSAPKNKCFSRLSPCAAEYTMIHSQAGYCQPGKIQSEWCLKVLISHDEYQYILIKIWAIISYWVDGLVSEALRWSFRFGNTCLAKHSLFTLLFYYRSVVQRLLRKRTMSLFCCGEQVRLILRGI